MFDKVLIFCPDILKQHLDHFDEIVDVLMLESFARTRMSKETIEDLFQMLPLKVQIRAKLIEQPKPARVAILIRVKSQRKVVVSL